MPPMVGVQQILAKCCRALGCMLGMEHINMLQHGSNKAQGHMWESYKWDYQG